ncbi:MAG: hypothetical protein ABR520_07500 [Mycobacteriales bacterium]|nr:hypothetical protein [Frankia sp.]
MLLLGLLLTAASAALAIEVVVSNTGTYEIEAFNRTTEVALGTLYVGGVITAFVFALGVAMIVGGLRHSWQAARDQRRAARETRDALTSLQAENRRLRSEVERARRTQAAAAGTEAPTPQAAAQGAATPPSARRRAQSSG